MSGIISRNRGMYKNQLQELAQRSCFNLPSYSCIREGPDHAPRFKATVNFNGETFESPTFCTTLRQAEHAAAEVALNELAKRGPSRALAARVLDESGVYKNLLQETAHRAGLNLPVYTTVRSGPGHVPVFSCTVELAGMSFMGEPSKTKKQAQKNAAMAAWSGLKQMSHLGSSPSSSSYPSSTSEGNDEQEQVIVARVLASLRPAEPNKLTRKNRQHSHRRSSTPCTDLNPLGGARSFQPMQYQGWSYPNFSPGVAMYQMWQQQQTTPQQSHCLTLPVPPTSPPGPQILPFIRSMFQPDQRNYFPAREQMPIPMVSGITMSAAVPSLYVSNPLMPVQVRGVGPQVTIQEIQEIGDPDHLKASTLSNASGFSQFEASKSQVSVDDHSAIVTQKTLQEEKERHGSSEIKIEKSVQLGGSQPGRIEGTSPRDMGNGYRPIAANPGHIKFMSHNPTGSEPSWSSYRPYYPSSLSSAAVTKGFGLSYSAASNMLVTSQPVATLVSQTEGSNIWSSVPVRTGGYSLPSIQKPAVTNSCGRLNPMMAPAVQIRTVVPVCTAAAPINKPGTSHEGCFPGGDEGNVGAEDVTAGSLGLDKLRI